MSRFFVALTALFILVGRGFTQLPQGFSDTSFASGFSAPTALAFAPDGRLMVCEQGGNIWVVKNGQVLATPFLSLKVSSDVERGVLGIAFDPAFNTNHFVYVYYTTSSLSFNPPATPKNRVSRFTVTGDTADINTEFIVVDLIPSDAGNHNAGCLRFGPDGKLYIATGDGGQNHQSSQDLTSLAGKILRMNSDGTIPSDNPFVGQGSDRGEIFMLGFRNPFRFCFRPGTSVMYIGDVGENTWEEVNVSQPGGNYGWPVHEGIANDPLYVDPIFQYQHNNQSAAIVGGCFLNTGAWPAVYAGAYMYGDYVRSTISGLKTNNSNAVLSSFSFESANTPVDFALGADGALYYVSIGAGTVQRIAYDAGLATVGVSPSSVVGGANSTGTLTLNLPAPSGGQVVNLTSTIPAAASVPAQVTIPSGAKTANFTVITGGVDADVVVTISASANGTTVTTPLTVLEAKPVGITLTPNNIVGGSNSAGLISLNGLAGPSGQSIDLSSDNAVAQVPSSVTIGAGQRSAPFTVTTNVVAGTTIAIITGTLGDVSASATLTVVTRTLASLTLNPTSVVGGDTSTGTATLSGPAAAGGQPVEIIPTSTILFSPLQVTVPAGQTSVTFPVHTLGVSQTYVRPVKALSGGVTKVANLTIIAGSLKSLTINPSTIPSGKNTTGTVTLNGVAPFGGLTVTLNSPSSVVHVPASVKVPANASAASFTITTNAISFTAVRPVNATYQNITKTAYLTLTPTAVLTGLTLNPSTVVGGQPSTGTVTISIPAPTGGTVVNISANSLALSVPATVTVPAGSSSANFTVTTFKVGTVYTRKVFANLDKVTLSANITLTP